MIVGFVLFACGFAGLFARLAKHGALGMDALSRLGAVFAGRQGRIAWGFLALAIAGAHLEGRLLILPARCATRRCVPARAKAPAAAAAPAKKRSALQTSVINPTISSNSGNHIFNCVSFGSSPSIAL